LQVRTTVEIVITLAAQDVVASPKWNEGDSQQLIRELQYRGYGWLRPEGVRKKLEEMTANWQGQRPLPWERDRSL